MDTVLVTEKAYDHLSHIVKDNKVKGVQLGVKGGGCAGFTYQWDLIDDIHDGNDIIPLYEGDLYIKPEAMMFLMNTVIDYTDGIGGSYIVFRNPNATSQCGCGESFGI